VGIAALVELRLLDTNFRLVVVHVDISSHICELRVQATCDKNITVGHPDGDRVGLEVEVVWHLFTGPEVTREVILQDQVLVIRVAKKVGLSDGLLFVIEEFECVLVGKLHYWMLQAPNLLKHLVGDLRIEAHRAVLELVERAVEGLVDASELILQTLHLRLVRQLLVLQGADLVFQLNQIPLAPLDIFLTLQQE
jgi:hypothetical protein